MRQPLGSGTADCAASDGLADCPRGKADLGWGRPVVSGKPSPEFSHEFAEIGNVESRGVISVIGHPGDAMRRCENGT